MGELGFVKTVRREEELVRRGDLKGAERLYRRTLLGAPRSFDALRGLGIVLQRQGRYAEAVERLSAALERRPDDTEALNELGVAQGGLDEWAAALESFSRSLAVDPEQPRTLNRRGIAHLQLGWSTLALEDFDRSLALAPGYADALNNRGNALRDIRREDEALASYDLALAANPELADASNNTATLLREMGRFDEAKAHVEHAIALRPKVSYFYLQLVAIAPVQPSDPHVAAMTKLLADPGTSDLERIDLNFALGKVFADAGEPDRAFAHLLEANAGMRGIVDYDEATTLGAIEALPGVFTPELLEAAAGIGDPSEQPVFIMGMPRSGTTLVEQILASHPQIFGAGETELFGHILGRAPTVAADPGDGTVDATGLWADSMRRLGADYLAALHERAPPDALRILDKSLPNWRIMGLIRLALPNARIIHLSRDPLDCCVSCFSRQFADLPYTYDLAELGRHYRAQTRLMDYWRSVTPEHILLQVRYEDVVADLEGQARRLVAHCGLEWDARCLDFHKTERRVQTASANQVRQPIYDSSIGIWRAYETHLGPLIEALGPLTAT